MIRNLCCVLLFLAAAATSEAARFRVDSTTDARDLLAGDGTCATKAGACTLRAAVEEASALPGADVIRVPAGHYVLSPKTLGDLVVYGRMRMVGAGPGSTIVDGGGRRVFDVLGPGVATFAKLTVRNGNADFGNASLPFGGGILAESSSRLRLTDVVVEDCAAFAGGGVAALGRVQMRRCAIRGNIGGGVALAASARIEASTFNDNFDTEANGFAPLDVVAQGRSFQPEPSIVEIVNDTLTGRLVSYSNCPDGADSGGCVPGADLVLANATVAAIARVAVGEPVGGSFTLRNSIVEQCDAEIISEGYNFVAPEGCTILGDLTGVVVGDDPLLGSLKDNGGPTFTRLPVAVSAAVDGGNPATPGSGGFACEPFDQRGVPRFLGMYCDIGAVEGH